MVFILDKIMIGFFVVLIIYLISTITASGDAKGGRLIPIKFRHIQGMPKLMEGEIVNISSSHDSINIDGKYSILKSKVKSKILTNSKMLTDKQKSVIQRSLVGMVIAGPLGLIVGGISGVGTKQKEETVNFFNLIYIDENDIEQNALFALENASVLMYLKRFVKS